MKKYKSSITRNCGNLITRNDKNHLRRLQACFHEAGHILTRWYFGFYIKIAVVLSFDDIRNARWHVNQHGHAVECEGYVEGEPLHGLPYGPPLVTGNTIYDRKMFRVRQITAEMEVLDCLSGPISEAKYLNVTNSICLLNGGEDDVECISQILRAWKCNDERQVYIKKISEDRAVALISSPQGSGAIKSIAEALMRTGKMKHDEIDTVCREHFDGAKPSKKLWIESWPPTIDQLRSGHIPRRGA